MRPLVEISLKLDYDFYRENTELYNDLYDRGAKLIAEAKEKFFQKYPQPLSSKNDLESYLNLYIRQKDQMLNKDIPEIIISEHNKKIAEVSNKLSNGNYLQTETEFTYAKEFEEKYNEWIDTELSNLIDNIVEYNKKIYNKWEDSSESL